MLNYDIIYNSYAYADYEVREKAKDEFMLKEIEKRQAKIKQKDDAIEDLKYERNLIVGDIIEALRQDVHDSNYNAFRFLDTGDLFWKAWRYSLYHADKTFKAYLDSKTKKEEKQAYEIVCSQVKHLILKDDNEFESGDEIIDCCYGTYYEFTYKIRGHEIYVCVPNFKKATESNYTDLLKGYIIRYRESDICIGWMCSDLDYRKIYDKMMNWINKNWPKEDTKEAK